MSPNVSERLSLILFLSSFILFHLLWCYCGESVSSWKLSILFNFSGSQKSLTLILYSNYICLNLFLSWIIAEILLAGCWAILNQLFNQHMYVYVLNTYFWSRQKTFWQKAFLKIWFQFYGIFDMSEIVNTKQGHGASGFWERLILFRRGYHIC